MKLQFLLESTPTANAKTNETPRTISIPLCEGHLQKHHDIQIHIINHTFAAFVFDYEHNFPKTLPNASFSFHVEVLTATEASPTRVTRILLKVH
jgi:hypothetical protein